MKAYTKRYTITYPTLADFYMGSYKKVSRSFKTKEEAEKALARAIDGIDIPERYQDMISIKENIKVFEIDGIIED